MKLLTVAAGEAPSERAIAASASSDKEDPPSECSIPFESYPAGGIPKSAAPIDPRSVPVGGNPSDPARTAARNTQSPTKRRGDAQPANWRNESYGYRKSASGSLLPSCERDAPNANVWNPVGANVRDAQPSRRHARAICLRPHDCAATPAATLLESPSRRSATESPNCGQAFACVPQKGRESF